MKKTDHAGSLHLRRRPHSVWPLWWIARVHPHGWTSAAPPLKALMTRTNKMD